jgi:hypothetical protein
LLVVPKVLRQLCNRHLSRTCRCTDGCIDIRPYTPTDSSPRVAFRQGRGMERQALRRREVKRSLPATSLAFCASSCVCSSCRVASLTMSQLNTLF